MNISVDLNSGDEKRLILLFSVAKVAFFSFLQIVIAEKYCIFARIMANLKTYLDVQGLTKRIGDLLLFEKISFSVALGQRIGLIAQNGSGKSTLLNIIMGTEDYNEGSIVFRKDIRVGYLCQTPSYPEQISVLEACLYHGNAMADLILRYEKCVHTPGNPGLIELSEEMDRENAWGFEQRIKEMLGKFKITDLMQPIGELSGGQLKRVALANVLILDPDLLILDEPTNHLDLDMIDWLEKYMARNVKCLLMVTHDRYFLDRVCNSILELDQHNLYAYNGNYEYYLEKKQQRMDVFNANVQKANNLYRKELDWMRRMPCARGHKARYRKEAFAELEAAAKQRIQERTARLEVKSDYIGSKIFEAEYVSKAFSPEHIITKDFYYNFSRYEKMGIIGGNGTGKSTFIKMLLGLEKPDSGRFVIGETVKFGYFSQENGLKYDKTTKVIDAVRDIAETIDLGGGRKLTAMQFLQHFLFPPERQQSYIYKLSGGERRRLYLCTVLMRNPNFLVLDEPTNDLDITTLQILEEYLADFRGCVIVVSHDRYFMDKVVDHLLVFHGQGVIEDFPGNYTQYREWEETAKKDEKTVAKNVEPDTAKKKVKVKEVRRRLTYSERKEMEQLEKEIEQLEKEKKDLETALCSGNLGVDVITEYSIRLPNLQEELDEKSMRWLELSEYAN